MAKSETTTNKKETKKLKSKKNTDIKTTKKDFEKFDFNESEKTEKKVSQAVADSLQLPNDVIFLDTAKVIPDPNQPRKSRDTDGEKRLEATIKETNGNLQAITVRANPDQKGQYIIITGEGRWRACKKLDLKVKAEIIIENLDSYSMLRDQMIENVARNDMKLIELAKGYKNLIDIAKCQGKKVTQGDLAKMFGESQTKISKLLKLANEDLTIQEICIKHGVENLNSLTYLSQMKSLSKTTFEKEANKLIKGETTEKALHETLKKLKAKDDEIKKTEKEANNKGYDSLLDNTVVDKEMLDPHVLEQAKNGAYNYKKDEVKQVNKELIVISNDSDKNEPPIKVDDPEIIYEGTITVLKATKDLLSIYVDGIHVNIYGDVLEQIKKGILGSNEN